MGLRHPQSWLPPSGSRRGRPWSPDQAASGPYHLLLSLLPPKPGLNPRTEPLVPPPAPQHVALGGPPGARVAGRADITPGELPGGETLREGPWSPVAHFCPEAKGVQAAQASCPAPHGARGPRALAPPSPSSPRPAPPGFFAPAPPCFPVTCSHKPFWFGTCGQSRSEIHIM